MFVSASRLPPESFAGVSVTVQQVSNGDWVCLVPESFYYETLES